MIRWAIIMLAYVGMPLGLTLDKIGIKPLGKTVLGGVLWAALMGFLTVVVSVLVVWWFVLHVRIV